MDDVFKALADPTRRALLDRLRQREGQTLSELCRGIATSRQAVTKHLDILEDAHLVTSVRDGRERRHYLNPVPIREIERRWVSKYTRHRADALLDLKDSLEERSPMKPEFNYVTIIAAPRRKVWDALTRPEFTRRYWFGSTVESDWKEGSTYTFRVSDEKGESRVALQGTIHKVDAPRELIYQFTAPSNDEVKDEDTTVQFLLEEVDGMTRLTVRHYGFEEGSKLLRMITDGWPLVLSGLKTLLESGKELGLTHGER